MRVCFLDASLREIFIDGSNDQVSGLIRYSRSFLAVDFNRHRLCQGAIPLRWSAGSRQQTETDKIGVFDRLPNGQKKGSPWHKYIWPEVAWLGDTRLKLEIKGGHKVSWLRQV